jgi:hypothetical protein
MTERTARRVAAFAPGPYLLSMVLPCGGSHFTSASDTQFGFQMVGLSILGMMYGNPVCIIGLLANVLFVIACVLLLIRAARGRPAPGYRAVFLAVVAVAPLMLISVVWVCVTDGNLSLPGSAAWLGSAIMLTVASWRLRHDQRKPERRGFDVIVKSEA